MGEHQAARTHHLRQLARGWLDALRDSGTGPYAGRAFPESFPFSETPLKTSFAWNEFYDGERWLHFAVELEFKMHIPEPSTFPPPPLTRYTWLVTSPTDLSILGFFEVDPRIFCEDQPLFPVDEALVLNGLSTSLQLGTFVEVSSIVLPEEPSPENCHYPYLDRYLEIFQMRTPDSSYVRELGRRWVKARKCRVCSCDIPPTGPRLCLSHIFERDGK